MPYLLLEGMADRYEHFLTATANISPSKISEDFHFRIQTIETPNLLVRHVRTHGEASNHGELSDAFYALMLSYPPGEFSSEASCAAPGQPPTRPTLHWHFPSRICHSHHRNSRVTYLRMESASLLRVLSKDSIAVSQLADLQGMAAPASLVQLIEGLGPKLAHADPPHQRLITEAFLNELSLELRRLLGPPKASEANAAGHTTTAIERMIGQLRTPICLQQLANELSLTPRTVQGCFKSQLAISPMRWLKLARLSQLRQLIWDPTLAHESVQQLYKRSGLSHTSLNRLSYKEVYGVTPREERRQAITLPRQGGAGEHESMHRQFNSLTSAIQYLEIRRQMQCGDGDDAAVAITITSSTRHGMARELSTDASQGKPSLNADG